MGPFLERIIWLLVTAQIVLQVCVGSQPESTRHLAGCQKTKEQILPLSGSSLPSPGTRNLYQGCACSKLEPLVSSWAGSLEKSCPNREKPSGRGVEHGRKPSCVWGRSRVTSSRFSHTAEPSAPEEMSISPEHKPLGKQVTGSLHTVSKVRAPGHSFLLWDQSIPFGLH